jgi:hypothetical protein
MLLSEQTPAHIHASFFHFFWFFPRGVAKSAIIFDTDDRSGSEEHPGTEPSLRFAAELFARAS